MFGVMVKYRSIVCIVLYEVHYFDMAVQFGMKIQYIM